MVAWYLAPSLAILRNEINIRWPRRDRTSDGTIGDLAHQGTASDHNPNTRGSVNAFDIDEDGIDIAVVLAAVKRHPSARYIIYERRLYHRLRGWQPEPYNGINPHDKHAHVSIDQTVAAEQDSRTWGLLEVDVTLDEMIGAVVKGVHSALDQAANRSTPTGRQMGDDIAVLLRTQTGPLAAELAGQRIILGQLVLAVAGVDEATKAQLQQDLDDLATRVAAVPDLTVDALGDLDSPEEIADRLRVVLGDQAAAVGALLAQS